MTTDGIQHLDERGLHNFTLHEGTSKQYLGKRVIGLHGDRVVRCDAGAAVLAKYWGLQLLDDCGLSDA